MDGHGLAYGGSCEKEVNKIVTFALHKALTYCFKVIRM